MADSSGATTATASRAASRRCGVRHVDTDLEPSERAHRMNLPHPITAARPNRREAPRARSGRSRRAAAVAIVAGLVLAGGCSSDGDPTTPTTTETSTTTTTTTPGPADDQTRPQSAFGMVHDGSKLWIADFYGGQVLAVDPDSGAVLIRYQGDDGVSDEIDDLAIGPDGSVYWTGFNDGAVGRMTPSNVVSVVAGLEPGINAIAFSPDGRLFVGRGVIGQGLWEIDLTQPEKAPRLISDELGNINSFAVGPDGMIYGPRWGTGSDGALVKINPDTAALDVIATGFDGPIAVKLDAAGTTAYVLSLPPGGAPTVATVALATGVVTPLATVPLPLADNLAVAPDGRVFVSAYNEPVIAVIAPDGTATTIGIGKDPPPEDEPEPGAEEPEPAPS
jgi:sugar lactone lactonase YvrE